MTNLDYKIERIRRGLKQGETAKLIGVSQWKLTMFECHGLALPEPAMKKLQAVLAPAAPTSTD